MKGFIEVTVIDPPKTIVINVHDISMVEENKIFFRGDPVYPIKTTHTIEEIKNMIEET